MGLEERCNLGLGVLKYMGLKDMSQICGQQVMSYEKRKLPNVVKASEETHLVRKDNKNNIAEGKKLNLGKQNRRAGNSSKIIETLLRSVGKLRVENVETVSNEAGTQKRGKRSEVVQEVQNSLSLAWLSVSPSNHSEFLELELSELGNP